MATTQHRIPAEDRRQQILEVARVLFSKKGFDGTTTREIAQAAKVNEAIIFRHFPTKVELYWAVIDAASKNRGARQALQDRINAGGDVRDVLQDIAEGTLNRRQSDPSFIRLLFFTALESHELSERFFTTYVAQYYDLLAEYITRQMDEGVLRKMDPMMATRAFFGMVIYHSLVQNLFGGMKVLGKVSNREVAESVTTIWLEGMIPDASHKRGQGKQGARAAGDLLASSSGTKNV